MSRQRWRLPSIAMNLGAVMAMPLSIRSEEESVNSSGFSKTVLPLPSSQVRVPVCCTVSAFSVQT
jgi:hypothetical protein